MGKYTQARQPLAVRTPLGPDALLLERFHGSEEMSRLFRFELDLLAESATDIPFDQVLGQKITVTLTPASGPPRYFSGIVSRLSQGRRLLSPAGDEFIRYRAEMAPQFWLLTRRAQSRIFQQLSVPDILKQVLQGLDVSFQIQGTFEPRDFCVQYRETDFAFASRLMEEEGIWYCFEHSADGHRLVLANTPSSHADIPGSTTVVYDDAEGGTRADDRVFAWEKTQEVRSGKVTLWDYCFELPDKNLEAAQMVQDAASVGAVSHKLKVANNDQLELYDYPGRYAQRFDGVASGGGDQTASLQKVFSDNLRTAGIRMQEETAAALIVTGESYCRQFTAGYQFTLDHHFSGKGSYVLTRIEHLASLAGGYAAGEVGPLKYQNRFSALPLDLPFRPERRTPRPTVHGTQTATVVGPSGEDIFLDKYGRVKVQFHWDRQGKNNAGSSCWVRVGQVWAGNRWGGFFWPRVGHEVIVAFEEGDPDQPVIVGSVYNADNMPPFPLPGNVMVGGIKSCSFGSKADAMSNFNGLVFYDSPGDEHVQVHSERHEISKSESSKYEHVGQSHVRVVGGFGIGGSGSGGGDAEELGSGSGGDSFTWAGTDLSGTLASDNSLVIGTTISAFLGYEGNYVIGSNMQLVINPLGWLALGGPAEGAAAITGGEAFLQGLGSVMGNLNLVLGTNNDMFYGPAVVLHRGSRIELHGDFVDWSTLLASVTGAAFAAAGVFAGMFPDSGGDPSSAKLGWGFGWTGAGAILLTILTSIESKAAFAQNLEEKAAEAQHLDQTITNVATPLATGLVSASALVSSNALQLATTTQGLVNQQAALTVQAAQRTANQALSNARSFNANYSLNAYDISFTSSYYPGVDPPVLPLPLATNINIMALGISPANLTGILTLSGTQQATLTSGLATVGVTSAAALGNVMIHCGLGGMVTLQRGTDPASTQMIEMAPTGISIKQGGGNITALATGNVELTASGGELNLLGTSISLTGLETITLTVEESSITINSTGITISGLNNKIQSEVQTQLQAVQAQLNAQAEFITQIAMQVYG